MCGRYGLNTDPTYLAMAYQAMHYRDLEKFRGPSWNCAPTQTLPIIRQEEDGRHLEITRWGWRRPFTKAPLINARADEILTRTTTFRRALAERRCIVPATHFYEWQVIDAKTKQPHAIEIKGAQTFAMAGLWEDETLDGVTERCHLVCTIEPNVLMREIHDRQPLILHGEEAISRWLDPSSTMEQVVGLIQTTPAELMRAWKVGPGVGNVRNNSSDLAAPI